VTQRFDSVDALPVNGGEVGAHLLARGQRKSDVLTVHRRHHEVRYRGADRVCTQTLATTLTQPNHIVLAIVVPARRSCAFHSLRDVANSHSVPVMPADRATAATPGLPGAPAGAPLPA